MYQRAIVIGNLGRDPEVRYCGAGQAVAEFSLAATEQRLDEAGHWQPEVTWFKCVCRGRLAETVAKHLGKGSGVVVEGAVRSVAWLDEDGNPRSTLELEAVMVRFLRGADALHAGDGRAGQAVRSETK